MSLKLKNVGFGVLLVLPLLISSSVFAASSVPDNNSVASNKQTDEIGNKNLETNNVEGKVPVSRVVKYPPDFDTFKRKNNKEKLILSKKINFFTRNTSYIQVYVV